MGPSGPAAVASCFGPIKESHEMPEQSDGISLSPQKAPPAAGREMASREAAQANLEESEIFAIGYAPSRLPRRSRMAARKAAEVTLTGVTPSISETKSFVTMPSFRVSKQAASNWSE